MSVIAIDLPHPANADQVAHLAVAGIVWDTPTGPLSVGYVTAAAYTPYGLVLSARLHDDVVPADLATLIAVHARLAANVTWWPYRPATIVLDPHHTTATTGTAHTEASR